MTRDTISRMIALLQAGANWQQVTQEVELAIDERLEVVDRLVGRAGVAPLDLLKGLLRQIDAKDLAERRVELAKAAPTATLRLVVWLPLAALLLGQLAGLGSLAVLLKSPLALGSVSFGVLLLIAGQVWSARLLTRAQQVPNDESFAQLLLASCLRAGFEFRLSRELVADALANSSFETRAFENDSVLADIVELSQRTGTPLADLISAIASERENTRQQLRLQKLERLSVTLMVPLGVTVLPAFVLIAVGPLALSFLMSS